MSKLTKVEMETCINYNQRDDRADIWTSDPVLIRQLEKYRAISPMISLTENNEDGRGYSCPKKWIKVKMPRQLTDAQLSELKQRGKNLFRKKNTETEQVEIENG